MAKQGKLEGVMPPLSPAQQLGEEFLGCRADFAAAQKRMEEKKKEVIEAMKNEKQTEMVVNDGGDVYKFSRNKADEKLSCHKVKSVQVSGAEKED